jgi:hypothetical protein
MDFVFPLSWIHSAFWQVTEVFQPSIYLQYKNKIMVMLVEEHNREGALNHESEDLVHCPGSANRGQVSVQVT